MVNVGDFADDSASDVSSGENVDDDSQPGDLQSYYEDDRNVPPQEKQQYLMTLCFSSIEGFTTDVLPHSHRLFEKQKKKFKATVNLLKKEIKRRNPDFKGLSNKKADDLIAILKGNNDMKLGEKDKRFIANMENQLKTSLQKVIDESASDSPSGNVNIGIGDKHRLIEAMLCDEAKAKLASSQECLSREQLDARNSVVNVLGYFETVAETFNSTSFTPRLAAVPTLHPDLADARRARCSCPWQLGERQQPAFH